MMTGQKHFEVIIIGGSYAGLSAAMSLGRAVRQILVIDSGKPCNIQTPHSHNYLTRDGSTPSEIKQIAVEQVLSYPTVQLKTDKVAAVSGQHGKFEIITESGEQYTAKKILLATGIRDILPSIPGFSESWGISIIHCPYCHGYEYRGQDTGVMVNSELAFEFSRLISNWTSQLTVFTNGPAVFDEEVRGKIESMDIKIVEKEIKAFDHKEGYLQKIVFTDGSDASPAAMYARLPFEQHSDIPKRLGCELTNAGYIKTDDFQRTSIPGVYAAGDNTTMMRSVSASSASGSKAGAFINHDLISEGL
jgi:thioredoxin reductase